MAVRKLVYSAVAAPAFAVEGLATSASLTGGYESATVDNTVNLYLDYQAKMKVTTGTTPTVDKTIELWVVPCVDGTNWPDVFDGTTSVETATSRDILFGSARLAASVKTDATSNRAYELVAPSVAELFGGFCPQKFVLFLSHDTGAPLNATAGNHALTMAALHESVV